MVELGGAAKYLREKKDSFKSVESALVYKVTTVVEKLHFRDDVKACISEEMLRHTNATHVVEQIYWGANYAIRVTDRNSENKKKKEVERCLYAHLQKLQSIVSAKVKGGLGLTEQDRVSLENFSLKIFGDVLPDKLPTNVDGAMEMMSNLSQLIQNSNDGKGKPLVYVMFPLSSPVVQNNLGINIPKKYPIQKIDEGQIVRIIQVYDRILEFIQKAQDHVKEMNNRSYCVTESELDEERFIAERLEEQEGSFRSDLFTVIKTRRAGKDSLSIPGLCTNNYVAANETFKECEKIFNATRSRIQFAEDCEEFGANHFEPPVSTRIAKARYCSENVYVLFHNKADSETVQRYQLAFIELAKNKRNDNTTACYVTWSEQTEDDVRIEHYSKGQLLHKDVTKKGDHFPTRNYRPISLLSLSGAAARF